MKDVVRRKRKFSVFQLVLSLFLFLLTLTMILPVLNIIARSLSDPLHSHEMGGLEIIPRGFSAINYEVVLGNEDFLRSIGNSFYVTIIGTILNVMLTTSAAYVLTRKNLVGKQAVMVFLVIMMLISPGLVPQYLVIRKLGLMGSQWSIILSAAVNVYYILICMRYFQEVPDSLCEAATIDGAGHLRILFNVVLPLTLPGMTTISMFYIVSRWNEYYHSSIYLASNRKKVPLQVILRTFVVSQETNTIGTGSLSFTQINTLDNVALQYACIVIAIVPILLVYPLVLKYYTKGIMGGGVKE
ncbi:MAG: carbohydrate ABC transporter permease [Clostridiales bacterium]|nr:carbohydrate ABC transporter permease [Clostridiales bacterium]